MNNSRPTKNLLYEKIYEHVAEKIQLGEFKEGDKISEEELAAAMGVSRTPVREALTYLSSKGIIEKIPRRGFFIRETNKEEKEEAYQIIAYLERLAVSLAINSLDEEAYNKLRELVAKMEIAIQFKNKADYIKAQSQFHEMITDCENKTLVELLHTLKTGHIPQTYVGNSDELFESFKVSNQEHTEILNAMMDKDLKKVVALIDKHWEIQFENLL